MGKFLAWSYSRLKTYLDCPRQLYHTQVAPRGHADRVDYVETQAMRDGKEIDEALTQRISKGVPLPEKFARFEPIAADFAAAQGQVFTQMNLALDQQLRPCGYKDWDNAWVRVIFDVAVIDGAHMLIVDWKNGKVRVDEDQLRLFATVGFHQFPEVDSIDTAYAWLQHGKLSPKSYVRSELPELWQTFIPDVERLQVSFHNQHWPAEPKYGKGSCKWCPVNRAGKCDKALAKYEGS